MTMTPTAYVKLVENVLGWTPPKVNGPDWKRYQGTVARVTRLQDLDPLLYTFENLQLTVEMLRKERKAATPMGVFFHVQRAVNMRADKEMDLEIDIREAVLTEAGRGDPDGWVERFARAIGPYRSSVLNDWRQAQVQDRAS